MRECRTESCCAISLRYQREAYMLSTHCIRSVAAIVGDGCGAWAQLVEHAWNIEGTRRPIGGPGIWPVRLPKGTDWTLRGRLLAEVLVQALAKLQPSSP